LLLAARAARTTREITLLGIMEATVLAMADGYGVTRPRTTWLYLLDAMIEIAFVAG